MTGFVESMQDGRRLQEIYETNFIKSKQQSNIVLLIPSLAATREYNSIKSNAHMQKWLKYMCGRAEVGMGLFLMNSFPLMLSGKQ